MHSTTNTQTINPFFASRTVKPQPVSVVIPAAPKNGSPVPHLTSLYHRTDRGNYGDASYPGNCGGNLIRDLLLYFQPAFVFDPMTGSGTCRDVCLELGIQCESTDLREGFDACNPGHFEHDRKFDFIWVHPPYWRMKEYSTNPNDLSRSPTLEAFLLRYGQLIRNCASVLKPGGQLAILMGDYTDRNAGFVPLTYFTKQLAMDAGLQMTCTDIIRFSHSATSSRKVYRSAFIPGLHDVCAIFTAEL